MFHVTYKCMQGYVVFQIISDQESPDYGIWVSSPPLVFIENLFRNTASPIPLRIVHDRYRAAAEWRGADRVGHRGHPRPSEKMFV